MPGARSTNMTPRPAKCPPEHQREASSLAGHKKHELAFCLYYLYKIRPLDINAQITNERVNRAAFDASLRAGRLHGSKHGSAQNPSMLQPTTPCPMA